MRHPAKRREHLVHHRVPKTLVSPVSSPIPQRCQRGLAGGQVLQHLLGIGPGIPVKSDSPIRRQIPSRPSVTPLSCPDGSHSSHNRERTGIPRRSGLPNVSGFVPSCSNSNVGAIEGLAFVPRHTDHGPPRPPWSHSSGNAVVVAVPDGTMPIPLGPGLLDRHLHRPRFPMNGHALCPSRTAHAMSS
jgi:hypothetical protein